MKFRSLHILPLLAALILAFSACEDSASPVGPSIVDDTVDIVIDSSFTVSGNVVRVQSIAPRTTIQMLGTLDIPGYGRLSSNVVTQFIPSVELDTANFGPAVAEQVEEEEAVRQIIDDLNLVGTDGTGLYQIDRQLATRTFVAPQL